MRRISYGQTSLTIGLFAIILVFVANGWVISSNVVALRDQQRWVSHTHEVIGTLEDILTKVTGAETASRGYLISHDRRFLDSFNSELKTSMENLVSVKALTADNPTQQESVRELDVLLRGREKAMQSTVENFERSRKVPLEDFQAGHEAMVALRRHVDIMENVERKLLSQRELAASEAYRFVQYTLSGVTAVMLLFAGLIYGLLRRHLFLQAAAAAAQARESRLRTAEADCATLVGGDKPIATIADQLVELVAQAIGAPGVNFFLVEGGSITFEAGYARSGASSQHRARSGELTYQLGDGLIGSAATRTEITQISQVPQDYFKLASSFGESTPAHLIFVPIRFQNHTVGLLEAALFRELQLEQIEWLQAAAHALGVGLNAAISRQRQQGLIEEMQRQSEELQSQQEELRTSNEELEEQAHELTQSQERLQVQQEELQQINQELEQQKAALESQSDALDERNRALEDAKAETERKAHELERTNLYKSEFLAKMSHELRTPLNSLMILSTLLHENRSGNLSAQQVEFAQTIFEAGGDLLTLINDILDLSKLEARKLMARPEPFTIAPFFDQMVAIFKPMLAAKNLDLLIEIGTDAPTELVTDRQRLQQIIRNLLSNAVKFTDSGSITLSAHAGTQPGLLKISVRDTGIGIPEEKKQLIFEAFEQADGSVSRRYGGTGLGLTISRELAYLLGGTITVQSNTSTGGGGGGGSEVGGSCFTIELPAVLKLDQDSNHVSSAPTLTGTRPPVAQKTSIALASAEAPAGAATSTASAHQIESPRPSSYAPFINRVQVETMQAAIAALPADAKTILIVEDDVTFRAAVADAARVSGFTPFEIENGETALEILRNHVPKAILLDIGLPGISGLAVLEQIKQIPELRHVPIHMISAMKHQQSALRMGALGYLMKPVTINAVRSALARIEDVISRKVKRLLIVEDDSKQRRAIADLVGGQDLEIHMAGTGKEALEALRHLTIDCVILDLSLPDCSGFELLERLNLREDISLPPIIIYTGKDLSLSEEDRLRRYSDSIIIKGAKSPERLLDEVSLFLHRVEADRPEQRPGTATNIHDKDRVFSGRKILVVDDDLRNVFALTSALETRGFQVTVARNGIEALENLEKMSAASGVDLVLMDIMMPKMDGFEAMKRIRANRAFAQLPVIALTAKTMKGEYKRCIEAGASDYLPKPIHLANLLSVIKVWLPAEGAKH